MKIKYQAGIYQNRLINTVEAGVRKGWVLIQFKNGEMKKVREGELI